MNLESVCSARKVVCDLEVWADDLQNSQGAFLTTFGFVLTFLTSKSNEFLCAQLNLSEEIPTVTYSLYCVQKLLLYDNGHKPGETNQKQNAFGR